MSQPTRYPGDSVDASPLGEPLAFHPSGRTAPNRMLKAAMTERLSSWSASNPAERGIPSPELVNAYRRWGEGGFGLILTGNIMVELDQLEAAGNAVVPRGVAERRGVREWADLEEARQSRFAELAKAAKSGGGLVVAQVSHPGRQVTEKIQPHPISASDVQLEPRMGMTFAKPRPATEEDIKNVIDGFADAAEFLYKAGFDGIQLHGAHGYLLAQFLSLSTNRRTDKYGGSLPNRARLVHEIADAVRARVPDKRFMLGIKLNSVEFESGGTTAEECGDLCAELEARGFDFIELSGGTYNSLAFRHRRESTRRREAFFIEFAEAIVPRLQDATKVYVTGGFRTAGGMVRALESVDGVGLGRPACQEFDLPNRILRDGVVGGIQLKLDEDDFGLTNMAAGTQIKMVGRDQKPIDLSQQENADLFKKALQQWMGQLGDDKEGKLYGYVDEISEYQTQPYGAAV